MIKTSIEWPAVEAELRHRAFSKIEHRGNYRQVRKMIDNIHLRVSELSKAEIEARRGKPYRAQELLVMVNEEIETVEEFLLVAALIG